MCVESSFYLFDWFYYNPKKLVLGARSEAMGSADILKVNEYRIQNTGDRRLNI
jgi:hypothetical protein